MPPLSCERKQYLARSTAATPLARRVIMLAVLSTMCGRHRPYTGDRAGQVPEPAGEDHRAAGARRRRRPRGAPHRRPVAHRHGPAVCDREPGGRRGRDRDADDRARAARWLHADDRLRRHARDQSRGETQSRLRRGQGLHAYRDARRHAQRVGRGACGTGQHAAGIRGLRQGQSRQGRLRHVGCRHAQPPAHGAVQARLRRAQLGRALSKHRPGIHRRDGRANPGDLSGTRRCIAACALGRVQAARRHRRNRQPLLPNVPTFKESGYEGFTGSRGTASSGPRNCPRTSRSGSTRRSTRCSPRPTCATPSMRKR